MVQDEQQPQNQDNQKKTVNVDFLGGHTSKSGVPTKGFDREKIDEIIREASKGSKYYSYQQERESHLTGKILALREKKNQLENNPLLISKNIIETEKWIEEMEYDKRDISRTFAHLDMDAFYAAVETLKRPELANKPMAVGGDSMLCTANYEARKFGVSAALPGYIAKKLCPGIILIPPDFTAYKQISDKVHIILAKFDPKFSSFSLDEASLDLTPYLSENPQADVEKVVEGMRQEIFKVTSLTCSVGIAPNRQLAKMCSNLNKPNGQFRVPADREFITNFMKEQPINRICGVGKVTRRILEDLLNIKTCGNLIEQAGWIRLLFSDIQSKFLLLSALGLGSAFGEGLGDENWNRKSISVERTFKTITSPTEMLDILKTLCKSLASDVEEAEVVGKTIGIKLKSSTFKVQTRAITIDKSITLADDLYKYSSQLLEKEFPKDLRLLGIRLSGLIRADEAGEDDGLKYKSLDNFFLTSNSSFITPPPISPSLVSRPQCPICGEEIHAHADNDVRINEHIDKCLASNESSTREEKIKPASKKSKTLDDYFKKPKV